VHARGSSRPGTSSAGTSGFRLSRCRWYLAYLRARFAAVRGRRHASGRRIASLGETTGGRTSRGQLHPASARSPLTGDTDLAPIRGQVVIVANPGITEFFADGPKDSTDLTVLVPRNRDTVLLGGTAVVGDWNRAPDPDVAAAIVARCSAVVAHVLPPPRFSNTGWACGRGRSEPRLEGR